MKIVCLGDSITAGVLVESNESFFARLQQTFPAYTFVNKGISGDSSTGGKNRFVTDVLSENPDLVIIYFGMNDTVCNSVDTPSVNRDNYRNNLVYFYNALKTADSKIIFCTINNVIEGDATQYYYNRHPETNYQNPLGVNAWIDEYSGIVKHVAGICGVEFVDINQSFKDYVTEGGVLNDLLVSIEDYGDDDGVHPNPTGHQRIANLISPKIEKIVSGYSFVSTFNFVDSFIFI